MATVIQARIVIILKEYANEKGVIVRSTSDISPLEEWLLIKVAKMEQQMNLPDSHDS